MRNAILTTLGILMLTVVGFAITDAGEPVPSLSQPATPAEADASASWTAPETATQPPVASPESVPITREPEAVPHGSCGPTVAAAGQTSDDPCVECWFDCSDEFVTCRQACGPIWDIYEYLACFDNCATEQIACERSCEPLCL